MRREPESRMRAPRLIKAVRLVRILRFVMAFRTLIALWRRSRSVTSGLVAGLAGAPAGMLAFQGSLTESFVAEASDLHPAHAEVAVLGPHAAGPDHLRSAPSFRRGMSAFVNMPGDKLSCLRPAAQLCATVHRP